MNNDINCDYIDAFNSFGIEDYVNNTITTNITTSNIYMNNNSILNESFYYSSSSNLYIKNNNSFGEIRFSSSINYPENTNYNYGSKIDFYGRLQVYHNYNLLQPTFSAGWYDVEGELLQLKADGINTDAQFILLEAGVVYVKDQIDIINATLINLQAQLVILKDGIFNTGSFEQFKNVIEASDLFQYSQRVDALRSTIKTVAFNNYLNAVAIGGAVSLGIGIAGGAIAAASSYISYQQASNAIYKNSNFTISQKDTVYQSDISGIIQSYSNFNNSISNLNIVNGFINSNIQTSQLISNLNSYNITLNGQNINNIFLSQNGGNMYNSLAFQKSTSGNPIIGYFGGDGDRIILNPSTTTSDYACSIGINNTTKKMWFSASSNYAYEYWFSGNNQLIISSNIMSYNNGTINCSFLQQNSQNITDISSNIVLTQTPNVQKKKGFLINVNNVIYPDAGTTPYYSYDIYLPSYISQAIVENTSDPYRVFRIHISYAPCYFEYLKNNLPNCSSYEIFMSYKANAGAGGIGKQYLNICALGYPENYYLDKVMPNDLFIMRSPFSYFDRICVISTKIADVRVIIEDLLN